MGMPADWILWLACAHATRSTYEARNGYKPYPNEAPGLFFTQFYSVSRSDECSYAWLCAHDREIYIAGA